MFEFYYKDENFVEPEDSIYYLIAANGVFQVKRNPFFTCSTLFFSPVIGKSLGWLQDHRASCVIHMPKRIERNLIERAINFFVAVHDRYHGAEAIDIIYWNEATQEFSLHAPYQEVAKSALPYYQVGQNPPGLIRFGTIHSHGSLPAFHSQTDKDDEKHDDGIHITVGNVDDFPSISCEVVCDGQRFTAKVQTIIDLNKFGAEEGFPAQWMKNVKEVKIEPQVVAPHYRGSYQSPKSPFPAPTQPIITPQQRVVHTPKRIHV